MIMCSINSMTRLESCPTIFGPGARGQFLASVFRRRSTVLLPFFLCSARTHRPRETVAVSQARCLGFSDFLPIPTLRTNRYDCSERSSLLRSRLIARRHLYGTGSDRIIMTDLPDHRWDSGLVLRMAQGLWGESRGMASQPSGFDNGKGGGGGNGNAPFSGAGDSALADHLPPQNLEAERWLLGGILLDNEVLHEIAQFLTADDFYRDAHQVIYRAISELYSAGKGVDAVTLADELTRRDQFKQIGGDEMLLEIANSVPHAANARYHAELVAQKATARRTAQAATDIIQEVYSNLFTAEELHQRATNRLATIQPGHGKKEPWPELTLNQEPDALPFPLDAFPEPLQRFCLGAAIVTSAAPDITGVSMLATASAAIGQSVNLYLKRTHQESPLLYVLTVADPGRSKTPAIKLVTRPLIRIDKKLRDESQLEKQAWEEAKKMVGKQAESTPPPPPRRAVVKDVTRESLVAILAANPRGVLANPDEATAWIGSFNQYRTRGTDRQFWLDIWSSTPHAVDREGGQRSHYVATPMVT